MIVRCLWLAALAAAVTFYCTSFRARVDYPAAQDELCWLGTLDALHDSGVASDIHNPGTTNAYSPHLYLRLAELSYTLCGKSLFAARLPGLIAALIAVAMVFAIVLIRVPGQTNRKVSCAAGGTLLLLSLPAFVQGPTIIDIDNTILVPLVIALCWGFERVARNEKRRDHLLFAVILAVSLWGRLTTPMVLLPLFVVLLAVMPAPREGAKTSRRLLHFGAACGAGIVAFVASWAVYCALTAGRFVHPFHYAYAQLTERTTSGSRLDPMLLASNAAQLVAWTGALAVLTALWLTAHRGLRLLRERRLAPADSYLIAGWFLCAGYTVVGGTPFGFPKYHIVALPLIVIGIALELGHGASVKRSATQWRAQVIALALAAVGAGFVEWYLHGDLVRFLRVSLREARLEAADPMPLLVATGTTLCLAIASGLILVAVLRLRWRLPIATALSAVAIASGLIASQRQNIAHANTGYSYGAAHSRETARLLDGVLDDDDTLVAPSEIVYALATRRALTPNEVFDDADRLLAALESENNRAFVVCLYLNTIAQLARVRDDERIARILSERYEYREIDRYQIWIRRKP